MKNFTSQRSRVLDWIVVSTIVILNLPNFLLLYFSPYTTLFSLKAVALILFNLSITGLLLSLFKKLWHFYFWSIPFFILLPLEIYYLLIYKRPTSTVVIGIAYETNFHEAQEFLGTHLIVLSVSLAAIILGLFSLIGLLKRKKTGLLSKARFSIASASMVCIFFLFLGDFTRRNASLKETKAHFWYLMQMNYPLGMLPRVNGFLSELREIKQIHNKIQNFKFGSRLRSRLAGKKIFVLIIGESARYANWSINGYGRKTSPFLSNEPRVISFSNAYSSAVSTSAAVPMIITRATAQTYPIVYNEGSLIAVFKELDFSTFWLSNQVAFGYRDTATTAHAREASKHLFDSEKIPQFDEALMGPFKEAISQANSAFIIIHTLGNHFDYSARYPEEFDIYKPSLKQIKGYVFDDPQHKDVIVNSYDNSIRYADYFIGTIINQLKSIQAESFVMYVSDHGENLYDDERMLYGHGHGANSTYEYHIPFFVWTSEAYDKANPSVYGELLKNKNKKSSHDNVFYTFIDMAGVEISENKKQMSLADSSFEETDRFVKYANRAIKLD